MPGAKLPPFESPEETAPDGDRPGASLAPVALVPELRDGDRSAAEPWRPAPEGSPRAYQAILLAGAALAATAFWLRPTPPRLLHADLRELSIEAAAAATPPATYFRDGTTRVQHVRTTMRPVPSSSELLGDRPAAQLTASWPPVATSPARFRTDSTKGR
jgi:hypothetical protein